MSAKDDCTEVFTVAKGWHKRESVEREHDPIAPVLDGEFISHQLAPWTPGAPAYVTDRNHYAYGQPYFRSRREAFAFASKHDGMTYHNR